MGAPLKRKEDPRFITGRGTYVDNIKLPGMVYLAILRSPYAHARIKRIDTNRARSWPGVLAVYTAEDLKRAGVKPMPVAARLPGSKVPERYPLAVDRVRFVGEGVAAVVAVDRYVARDALDLIEVEYEPLPAVVDPEEALKPEAPRLFDDIPDNISFRRQVSAGDVERAFAEADGVVRERLINHRLVPNAMEPRAAVAWYQPGTGDLTLYSTNQNPHIIRSWLISVIDLPEHKVRVIAPDVGGGFGSKIFLYPDEVVAAFASMQLGRPVKWVEDRSENFRATIHGRDHITDFEVAYKRDGTLLGLKVRTYSNLGAYLSQYGQAIAGVLYTAMLHGVYRLPNVSAEVIGVLTNTTPTDAYRGAGRPEAAYLLERVVDRVARELNFDPAEIRRRNFIPPFDSFYKTPLGTVYDSGNYPATLERALELVGYRQLREEQRRLREQGRYIGIGLSTYVEITGLPPTMDGTHIRVHPTGKVEVFTGTHAHGQGHETTFAQLVADQFGISPDDVEVHHGDTGSIPYGSRSAPVGGSATYQAALKVVEKARKVAAHLLEAAEADVEFQGGRFFVRGAPEKGVTFQQVAAAAYNPGRLPPDLEPGLEATAFYSLPSNACPFGAHVAVVEVDPETGQVKLLRYVAVDDCGRVMNPLVVEGQVHGGVAQGIGQALWEYAAYDEQGNLLTGSMLDYALPVASYLPSFETARTETPSPVTPLGVKGVGEAGTIGATQAVVNAVVDALEPFGVKYLNMPLTPERVWRAIRTARLG
ncbi:MAG: carbon monoxide dehydrogenase [Chloroflexota bacterium]